MIRSSWTVFPVFHAGYQTAERDSGQFLRRHIPAIVVFAAVFWIPAVARASGIPPLAATLVLAVQVAQGSVFTWTRASIRWPVPYGVFAITTNLLVAAALIALTRDPRTPLWGIYPAYPLLVAFAITLSVYFTALVVVMPLIVAFTWAGLGMVPLSASLGPATLSALVTVMVYVLISSAYQATRDEGNRQLKALAVREEQMRIADELHGSLGAALTEISLWNGIAAQAEGDAARDALERVSVRTRAALTSLRACVGTFATEPLAAATFEQRLHGRVGELCRSAGVEARFTFHGPPGPVSAVVAYHVTKFIEEALVNAIRHAHASSIAVGIVLGPSITIEIMDDGAGFDLTTASTGHGMSSLRGHARALGRELSITSSPGAGTQIGLGAAAAAA